MTQVCVKGSVLLFPVIYVILQQWIFLSHRPKDSNVQLTPVSQRFRLYTAQFQTVFSTFGSLWGHREGMSAIWLSQAQNSAWCFWWAANHNQKSLPYSETWQPSKWADHLFQHHITTRSSTKRWDWLVDQCLRDYSNSSKQLKNSTLESCISNR